MNRRNKLLSRGAIGVVILAAFTLAVRLSLAQAPGPDYDINETSPNAADVAVYNVIPIQGRLTDADDHPIDGYRTITFSLYATSFDTVPLCQDDDYVYLEDGLFTEEMDWCTSSDIDGKRLYLGIQVEGDTEMTPREEIFPVPYAFSLRPGAVISGSTSAAIVHIENWNTSGRGLRVYAMSQTGTNYGVIGASRSPNGYGGYFYNNGGGTGLYGLTDAASNNYGIYTPDNLFSLNIHTTGAVMQVVQNGGVAPLETGDVVVFSGMGAPVEADGAPIIQVATSTSANSTAVAGVVHSRYDIVSIDGSASPESVAAASDEAFSGPIAPGDYLLVVVQGPARVKARAVAGALQPGDLLATSGSAGEAGRAAEVNVGGAAIAPPGTILGKALEPLKEGQGLIYIYVTLQ